VWAREGGWRVYPDGTMLGGGVRFDLKSNFKWIQILSNFYWFKKDFPELKKFEIKYGWEVFEEGNNFFIGTSPDFKWISNDNLGNSRYVF
jgi:hypothetical protein